MRYFIVPLYDPAMLGQAKDNRLSYFLSFVPHQWKLDEVAVGKIPSFFLFPPLSQPSTFLKFQGVKTQLNFILTNYFQEVIHVTYDFF